MADTTRKAGPGEPGGGPPPAGPGPGAGPGGPGGGPGGGGPLPPPFPEVAGGYHGKLLRVNLSDRSIKTEQLSYQFCRKYIGGAGFVAYYLWKELKPGIDALGPDNKLVFALGPVTGLVLPGAARYCVGAKSPLMGAIAKSESGGFWMAELKRAGFDAIIVEGKADKPVYLWVQDGQVTIKDAAHLWGKETKETEETIRKELGDEHVQVAVIGPAGENMVRFACIMTGLHDAAGRGGLGAVMGSKNLKAIAARGHKLPPIANEERLKEIRQLMSAPHPMSQFGTGGPEMPSFEASGNLPIRNFREGIFPEVKQITGAVMKDTGIRTGMEGCFACPIRCKKMVKFEEPYHCDEAYGGPEYETLAALGSDCAVGDLKAICKGNERCGAYSLDTISTGSVIAFAMECYEKGLLTKKDTGGLELKWGDADVLLKAIDLIARREGIGNLMAEGTARMAKKIGRGAEDFAMHVKGLEPGMHDPRFNTGLGIGYTINPHGADHCSAIGGGGTSPRGIQDFYPLGILAPLSAEDLGPARIGLYKLTHSLGIIKDCLVMCAFPPANYERQIDILKAVTGWDTGIMELLRISERVWTLMRLFNIREGFTAADDVMPLRYFQPKTNGALANKSVDRAKIDKVRGYYYFFMGWDANGVPRPEKLAELGIE